MIKSAIFAAFILLVGCKPVVTVAPATTAAPPPKAAAVTTTAPRAATTTTPTATSTKATTSLAATTTSTVQATTTTSTSTTVKPTPGTYPWHTKIVSTTFWVGELFNANAADGSQVCSTYDSQWALHWSGIDSGQKAKAGTDCAGATLGGCDGVGGWQNCQTESRMPPDFFPSFTPLQNPFYLDLPFDDLNNSAAKARRCTVIPWAPTPCSATGNASYMKNRWVQIVGPNGATCYGQVEDAGPGKYNDATYVFGATDARPQSTAFNNAGMDVSPALNGCLGFAELDGQGDLVNWKFVDVPPAGPWTKVITTSAAS